MQINHQHKFNQFRESYQVFFFDDFHINLNDNNLEIIFDFRIDDFVSFHPSMKIAKKSFYHFENLKMHELRNLAFHIGMVEVISYWKAICPKKLVIKPFKLSDEQKLFWRKLYFNGLGEFFYTNGIITNENDFIEIETDSENELQLLHTQFNNGTLIPVGGGKDSVVSLELLKQSLGNSYALIMNPRGASLATAKIAGFENKLIEINRSIDSNLLELNKQGFLNGHTPFSALLGFVCLLAATLTQERFIALSNESSANEPSIPGTKINHQYSKSFEFESDFRAYYKKYISPEIEYFSFLRPISELKIASIFSIYPQYFFDFKSCNAGSKQDIWCGKCSKCLFAFIILSPFIKPELLSEIFGKNMLDDINMKQYFKELTGIADEKPFECVGTINEVRQALAMTIELYPEDKLPVLLAYYNQKRAKLANEEELNTFSDLHFLPATFLTLLEKAIK